MQENITKTCEGFPHARGGVSYAKIWIVDWQKFSPRTWGCFRLDSIASRVASVFPTHVGVFPTNKATQKCSQSFPHARGGVSMGTPRVLAQIGFSPRTWGCFSLRFLACLLLMVFPTHVGVFPRKLLPPIRCFRFPHARGGVSLKLCLISARGVFSPRTWGCFSFHRAPASHPKVFPTHVGVFPGRAALPR